MTPADTSFLLNALPAEVARSYLHRTFGWRPGDNTVSPSTLFVRYYSTPPPEICASIVETFPDFCRIVHTSMGNDVFLISANPLDFTRILAFISTAGSQLLYKEMESLLDRKSSPCFKIRDQVWQNDRPRIMGILNITPDSFYDGGQFFKRDDYGVIARKMINAGADIIDIGGESSRPGAQAVDEKEELDRVLKVVEQIRKRFHVPLSIDTVKPIVADAALATGADMVNDISGLASGQDMLRIIQKHNASYCLMHIHGMPENMQDNPHYDDIIGEIHQFFRSRLNICAEAGLEKDRILLDPGIGFGKTVLNNVDILRLLCAFSNLDCLTLLGTSNKSFIGEILGRALDKRTPGTMSTQVLGWTQGASVFRVHDVEITKDTLKMAHCYTSDFPLE